MHSITFDNRNVKYDSAFFKVQASNLLMIVDNCDRVHHLDDIHGRCKCLIELCLLLILLIGRLFGDFV